MPAVRLDSEERRAVIVEAALPRFAQKGFAGTTTKEIAEAAGISEALLFKHFPTKDALVLAVLEGFVDEIEAAKARVLDGGGQVIHGPMEVPGGAWVINGIDPQGAMFALVAPPKSA